MAAHRTWSWALVTVAACAGAREPDFISEWEKAFCTAYVACGSEEMLRIVGERECHAFLRNSEYPLPPDCKDDGVLAQECLDGLKALADGEADAADRYDQALAALVAADPSGFEARARAVAEDLSLGAVSLGQSVGSLSGGQRSGEAPPRRPVTLAT